MSYEYEYKQEALVNDLVLNNLEDKLSYIDGWKDDSSKKLHKYLTRIIKAIKEGEFE